MDTTTGRRSFAQALAILAVVLGVATIPSTGGVLAWPLFAFAGALAGAASLRSPVWRVVCGIVAGLAVVAFAGLGLLYAALASSGF